MHTDTDTRTINHTVICAHTPTICYTKTRTHALINVRKYAPNTCTYERQNERSMSYALPMFHALTGCDTVASFVRHGKKTAWSTWESLLELAEHN